MNVSSLLLLGAVLSGCSSLYQTDKEVVAPDVNKVVGTWEYRTTGSRLLGYGHFEISYDADRETLRGWMQDSRLGTIRMEPQLRDSRLKLRLGNLLISGVVRKNEKFESTIRLMDRRFGRNSELPSRTIGEGALHAHRIKKPGAQIVDEIESFLNCPRFTVEGFVPCS